MLTLIRQNQACPICIVRKNDFANLQMKQSERTVQEMDKIFHHAQDLEKNGDIKRAQEILQNNGLVNVKVKYYI